MSTHADSEKAAVDREQYSSDINKEEKSGIHEEQIETVTTRSESDDTLAAHNQELNNKYAVKGDNSDGKVVWNWKTRIAAFCLVTLYVGELQMAYCCMKSTL